VNGLLAGDPYLAALVPTLTNDGNTLAQATTAAAVQAAVTTLGNDLDTVGTTLSDEAASGFTLGFVGTSSQTAQPQVAATFQLSLQNTGSQTTTYDLSLAGLPSGVTGSLSQPSITLGPGQVTPGTSGVPDLTVTLTSTSNTSLAPFSFTVAATAEGAPEITQSITGSLSARSALVQVTSVTSNPPFTNPGGQVDVQAQILNAVNKEQQAEVSYTVTDASGTVVYISTPVTTTLNVLTTLSTVDLGNLNTTGFALGDDTITVTVSDSSGNPIAGGTATGTLLIGTPVSAILTTTPASLPAGSGTVTATLQVNSQSTFAGPLALDGQAAIAGGASVAVDGTLAYVGASSDIDAVDISNPTKPTILSTFGSGDFPAGSNVTLQVYNGELVVLAGRNSATSSLLVYSLANPMSPSLLGQTPLTFGSGNDSYLGISSIANNQVYTGAIWYRFGGSNAIFARFGESLDVDISNPAAPKVVAAIYNDPPVPSTGYPDGTSNIWQSAAVNNDELLVGSTTATGSTMSGSGVEGIVMVVDTSNPGSPSVVEKLPIPGMAVVTGIAVNGNEAFVIGSAENLTNGVSGLGGNVVVATLDLTNPQSPTVASTQTLSVASIGIGSLTSLGNNLYVTSSVAGPKNGPQILLFNAADPGNVAVTQLTVPASIGLGGFAASSNLLFTADGSNLLVYNLGQAAETPVTAEATIPTGSGVSVIPGSFSIAPINTVDGPSSETLE
jgi:large repetitive protein